MFRTVLIANRGEIAVRVSRACRELGIRTVAVYSDADERAMHVRCADASYRLGPAPAAQSYLNIDAVLLAARASGAEAIHPGYGFLSENPDFAAACASAGVKFVGPSAEAMARLGDKARAKALARTIGVPVIPGYERDDQDDAALLANARVVGFPLLIKATAGGGGRGMRLVEREADFVEALAAARREALAAFGNAAVLLERRIPGPSHVEIQVLADAHGHAVHLGERDCSVQRRHQKVIEESPSPAITPRLRAALGDAALALIRAADYENAATVEFILDPDGAFYFLEVNTRLQVEHPVTELVTGVDLVREQMRIAAGEPLSFGQRDVALRGHAIEWRLYAEDPAQDFAPSAGTVLALRPPEGPGLRFDAGYVSGDRVTTYYDALLGKLIVYAADRAACLERATAALAQTAVLGVTTNLPLLGALARDERLRAGEVTTEFLDEHLAELLGVSASADADPASELLLAAVGWRLTAAPEDQAQGAPPAASEASKAAAWNPWRSGPWAVAGTGVPLRFRVGERAIAARAERSGDGWRIEVGDLVAEATFARVGHVTLLVREGTRTWNAVVVEHEDALHVASGARAAVFEPGGNLDMAAVQHGERVGARPDALKARLPGTVVSVRVREGERVREGQTLLVLDSMKTEHLVTSPRAGVVRRLLYGVGDLVPAGAALAEVGT